MLFEPSYNRNILTLSGCLHTCLRINSYPPCSIPLLSTTFCSTRWLLLTTITANIKLFYSRKDVFAALFTLLLTRMTNCYFSGPLSVIQTLHHYHQVSSHYCQAIKLKCNQTICLLKRGGRGLSPASPSHYSWDQ
jgi:hypothetical protein